MLALAPGSPAWEAAVLPLSYVRVGLEISGGVAGRQGGRLSLMQKGPSRENEPDWPGYRFRTVPDKRVEQDAE